MTQKSVVTWYLEKKKGKSDRHRYWCIKVTNASTTVQGMSYLFNFTCLSSCARCIKTLVLILTILITFSI
jgi:uncharacterized membrane protein YhaH (DUF805 family)